MLQEQAIQQVAIKKLIAYNFINEQNQSEQKT
jgi:hypothetical protein